MCPSGAIRYAYPAPRDLMQALKAVLVAYRGAGGQAPRLLLHDAEGGHDLLRARAAQLPVDVLPLQVEEITAAGLDVWLSAIAYGASGVGLLLGPSRAGHEASTLDLQLRIEPHQRRVAGQRHDRDAQRRSRTQSIARPSVHFSPRPLPSGCLIQPPAAVRLPEARP